MTTKTDAAKILMIDDSPKTLQLIASILKDEFLLEEATNFSKAQEQIKSFQPDLILSDVQLNGENGLHFYAQHIENSTIKKIPFFFLTSHSDIESKMLAFSLGAADYLVKPFEPLELLIRVRARINKKSSIEDDIIVSDSIKISPSSHSVYVYLKQKYESIVLSPIQYKLLLFFAKNPDKVFSRDQIFNHVWGENTHYLERTVDRHVSTLKKKLSLEQLQSVYSIGYIFKTIK